MADLTSGVHSSPPMGFRGTQSLCGGLAAKFVNETEIALDTGGLNHGNVAVGRLAYVGMTGGFGALTLGRQYAPR